MCSALLLPTHARLGLVGEHRLEATAHIARDAWRLFQVFEIGFQHCVEAERSHIAARDGTCFPRDDVHDTIRRVVLEASWAHDAVLQLRAWPIEEELLLFVLIGHDGRHDRHHQQAESPRGLRHRVAGADSGHHGDALDAIRQARVDDVRRAVLQHGGAHVLRLATKGHDDARDILVGEALVHIGLVGHAALNHGERLVLQRLPRLRAARADGDGHSRGIAREGDDRLAARERLVHRLASCAAGAAEDGEGALRSAGAACGKARTARVERERVAAAQQQREEGTAQGDRHDCHDAEVTK
mmetsp:Transcript_27676/g.67107  ORF Transcript_27676/g.67107 Transcript_27676/m.67107 type:complete len:299 (-) Transcript_27676:16-912(-)